MIIEIEDFTLAFYSEITPPPAPGTSPEAPGGRGNEESEDEGIAIEDEEDDDEELDDRPHIGPFEFPE